MFWWNKWVWNNVLVKGKQRKGSLAPVLVNISSHGVASLPAMLLYVRCAIVCQICFARSKTACVWETPKEICKLLVSAFIPLPRSNMS